MSLLSYNRLCQLVEEGVIEGADMECINSASIDIHLGHKVLLEKLKPESRYKYLRNKDPLEMHEVDLREMNEINLHPGEFILAQSREIFHLPPTISGEYKLKSSMARLGLDHANAGWCDAGWNTSVLTLELKNISENHISVLTLDDRIGQIVFFEHEAVPADKSYAVRGRYNGDKTVSGVKKDPTVPVTINCGWVVAANLEQFNAGKYMAGPFPSWEEADDAARRLGMRDVNISLAGYVFALERAVPSLNLVG